MERVLQYAIYLALLVALAVPLGAYIAGVMNGERVFLSRLLAPCEKLVYRIAGLRKDEDMSVKKYLLSAVAFNIVGFLVLFLIDRKSVV